MPKYGTHRRTGKYNDWSHTYKAASMCLLEAGKALNSIALTELGDVASGYLKELDSQWPHGTTVTRYGWGKNNVSTRSFGGDKNHPWWSGQLHDSVAVRVMQGNRIAAVRYMPPSPATGEPQHTKTIQNIVGVEWAHKIAEEGGARYLLPGVQVQLIVGVPYAEDVNESSRHSHFMDSLSNDLYSAVNQWVFDGGLTRTTVIATENGAKVVNKTNVRRLR